MAPGPEFDGCDLAYIPSEVGRMFVQILVFFPFYKCDACTEQTKSTKKKRLKTNHRPVTVTARVRPANAEERIDCGGLNEEVKMFLGGWVGGHCFLSK